MGAPAVQAQEGHAGRLQHVARDDVQQAAQLRKHEHAVPAIGRAVGRVGRAAVVAHDAALLRRAGAGS
jgi:rRNA-processing protein FCF1